MSKYIQIKIEIDGPAFSPLAAMNTAIAQQVELGIVLDGLRQTIFTYGIDGMCDYPVLDSQGGRVGTVELFEDDT